ncbi:tRNA-dihydrouridine synthase family protein, partial [Candidatus Dojkabacteria bacterium]|nr:tRNA-dihydrouridine synthase family protein [Candidatus Dojkabacteria bacterium]
DIKKPILALAPMEDVTDFVFRELISDIAKPDVLFTEFTNVDGLFSNGKDQVIKRLKFSSNQHPIVAQIWGSTPKNYFESAKLIYDMGFDGIDINMGCPVRAVIKQRSGAALIKYKELAKEIIKAAKEGAGKLPVSVKTRIGLNKIETNEWVSFLLNQNIDVLTIHGRTAKDKSKVPANWDEIKKAV